VERSSRSACVPFVGFKDTVAPTIEKIEIELPERPSQATLQRQGRALKEKRDGRLCLERCCDRGEAYDRVDGNAPIEAWYLPYWLSTAGTDGILSMALNSAYEHRVQPLAGRWPIGVIAMPTGAGERLWHTYKIQIRHN